MFAFGGLVLVRLKAGQRDTLKNLFLTRYILFLRGLHAFRQMSRTNNSSTTQESHKWRRSMETNLHILTTAHRDFQQDQKAKRTEPMLYRHLPLVDSTI